MSKRGKDHRDFTTYLRLGKKLSIREDTFEDIDEVIDRYVDPLVSNLKEILAYRKFRRGTKAEVDDVLQKEKYENPEEFHIIYLFHINIPMHLFSLISGVQIRTMSMWGYILNVSSSEKCCFDKLIAYFQKHINDLVQDSLPPIRFVAAMVPMKSPGLGGSAGGDGGLAD